MFNTRSGVTSSWSTMNCSCSEYISEAVRYQLQYPASDEGKDQTTGTKVEPENVQEKDKDKEPVPPIEERTQPPSCTGQQPTALLPGAAKRKGCKRKFTARAGRIVAAPQRPRATWKEMLIFRLEQFMESVEFDEDREQEEVEEAKKQVISMRQECRAMAEAREVAEMELLKVRGEKKEAISMLEVEGAALILATGALDQQRRRLEGLERETRETNNGVLTALRKHIVHMTEEKEQLLDTVKSLEVKKRILREQLSTWKSTRDTQVGRNDISDQMKKAKERIEELEDNVRQLGALNEDLREELNPNPPGDEDDDG